MSILDLHGDELESASAAAPYIPQPKQPRFSAWSAIPRGVGVGLSEIGAAVPDAFSAAGDMFNRVASGFLPEPRSAGGAQWRQSQQDAPINWRSIEGAAIRDQAQAFRPDPEATTVAESLLFDASRVITKGVTLLSGAGTVGGSALLAGDETLTQADQLVRRGVDADTALAAGAVQGTITAVGVGLPMAGTTLARTAGLYALGGPLGFMAQQQLTREILAADYPQVADTFDPFDPVGLAVASLVPLPFAAMGLRAARRASAEAFRAGPVPSEPTAVASAVADAYRPSPEYVDAARVSLLTEQRARASLAEPGDLAGQGRHAEALARAEDQIAAGERVSVGEVAPRITPEMREANFKAWFGDSKVVDAEGRPLVVYHGTGSSVAAFDPSLPGPHTEMGAVFLTQSPSVASHYADVGRMFGDKSPNVMPVYASVKNPFDYENSAHRAGVVGRVFNTAETYEMGDGGRALVLDGQRTLYTPSVLDAGLAAERNWDLIERKEIQDAIKAEGHDGFYVGEDTKNLGVYDPKQIKSAIGNSGRFDPSSASLTDPLEDFAAGLRSMAEAVRAEAEVTAPRADAAPEPSPAQATDAPAAQTADTASPAAKPADPLAPEVATAPAPAADTIAPARLEAITQQFPDLKVQLDGMDSPMPLSEFLAMAKAEADEIAADAPLMQIAAECALLNGV